MESYGVSRANELFNRFVTTALACRIVFVVFVSPEVKSGDIFITAEEVLFPSDSAISYDFFVAEFEGSGSLCTFGVLDLCGWGRVRNICVV